MKLHQPVKGEMVYAPDGVISQFFGDNPQKYNVAIFGYQKGHGGIDFWGTRGTPIYAAHAGTVVYADDSKSVSG